MENEKSVKEKLEEAQKAVENLQEPFKTMAFQKMLERIFNENSENNPSTIEKKEKTKTDKVNLTKVKRIDPETQKMLETLNRTEYPEIKKLEKVKDLSLYVLRIMEAKGFDSLTPSQVSDILIQIFRKPINKQAVSMALMKADEFTHRTKIVYRGSIAFKYKLMDKGETYIKDILEKSKVEKNEE